MAGKHLTGERELIALVIKADQRAFRAIYDHYYEDIHNYVLRLLKSVWATEEVVQETFLKIWKMGAGLEKIDNLEAYLITISRNRCLDILRRIKLESLVNHNRSHSWSEGHNETEEQIMLNDTRKILQDAIELLPPQQKLVYQLCHQEGLKYAEVAKILNLSPHTVQSYMKLALATIRKYMGNHTDMAALLIIFKLF